MDMGTGVFYGAIWRGIRATPADLRAHFLGAAMALIFRGETRSEQIRKGLLILTGSSAFWDAHELCIKMKGEPLSSSGLKSLFDQQYRALRKEASQLANLAGAVNLTTEMGTAALALASEQALIDSPADPRPICIDSTWLAQNSLQIKAWSEVWNCAKDGAKAPAPKPVMAAGTQTQPSGPPDSHQHDDPEADVEFIGVETSPVDIDGETLGIPVPPPAQIRSAIAHSKRSLALDENSVRVADITLAKSCRASHPLTPSLSRFRHICLDSKTLAVLRRIARAVHLGEPLLLQGATGTSKTSLIIYLAALLEQPIIRMNLNGQTDASELVGRFLPGGGADGPGWRWCDGAVPKAMKEGLWLILDEMNLAEPQVIERLNPVLEENPQLVLSEHEDEVVSASPTFRIFGTMNPAEYAGRSSLSPAYRNRWRMVILESAGEREYLSMLERLVWGRQPKAALGENRYDGWTEQPYLKRVKEFATIDPILKALSRFHTAMEHAAGQYGEDSTVLGSSRRERYIFTRRDLLAVMRALDDQEILTGDSALVDSVCSVYLDCIAPEDRPIIQKLLEASGLTQLYVGGGSQVGPSKGEPQKVGKKDHDG